MTRDEAKIEALKAAVAFCSGLPSMGQNAFSMVVDMARSFELYLTEQEPPPGNPVLGSEGSSVKESEPIRVGQSRKRPY